MRERGEREGERKNKREEKKGKARQGRGSDRDSDVFMQYCGTEHEATLREPYLNADYQVQNLRQFVCELECGSCTSSRAFDLKASWISLSNSKLISNASKSNTSSAQPCTRGSLCWHAVL